LSSGHCCGVDPCRRGDVLVPLPRLGREVRARSSPSPVPPDGSVRPARGARHRRECFAKPVVHAHERCGMPDRGRGTYAWNRAVPTDHF